MSARPLAVVTGPSRGIGRATALALAGRGHDLALLGRPGAQLSSVADEVRNLGAEAHVIACDVREASDISAAASQLDARPTPPAVVVHNAGIVRRGVLEDTAVSDWDDVIATNLRAPYLLSRALLPNMRRAGGGRIVFVASISSTVPCPGNASYAASKWGLLGLHKSLAEELRGSGVCCFAILPGSVDTDMLVGSGFAPAMSPADVARAISFLALDAPEAMHGSALEMFG